MRIATFCFIFALFSSVSFAQSFDARSILELEDVVVRVRRSCSYPNITNPVASYFNAFFVGHKKNGNVVREQLIGPGHGMGCDDAFNGALVSLDIFHRGETLRGGVAKKVLFTKDFIDPLDNALFEIDIPASLVHKHIALADINEYQVGDEVFLRAFFEPGNLRSDVFRYKSAFIEWKGKNSLRISTGVYPGMSGGLVFLKKKNKFYAIGPISRFSFNDRFGFIDVSWVSIIPKDFLK